MRRVLTLKSRLGLFDDPYRRGPAANRAGLAARRRLARAVAARAIVMLKNDGDVLPLARRTRRLAVIGPLADAPAEMRGPWWGAAAPEGPVSVVAGLRALLSEAQVLHAPGVAIDGENLAGFRRARTVRARGCHPPVRW